MNRDEFVQEMDAFWSRVHREAMANKDPREATREVSKLYSRFDRSEQSMARDVIVGWLRAEDPAKQFSALVLVDELGIVEALPTLRELQSRAEERTDHEAPYDWTLLNRIIGRFASRSAPS